MFVEVVGLAVHESDISTRNASDWSGEAIVDSHLQPPHIEIVKIAIKSGVPIGGFKISIVLWSESLSKEVPDMAEYNEDEVADIGCQEVIVGRFIHNRLRELSSIVFADISMALVTKGSKLRIYSCLSFGFCD